MTEQPDPALLDDWTKTRARRGKTRLAVDRDLAKLRGGTVNAVQGRDALVKIARDLADTYDQGGNTLPQLLEVLDRLGVGKVPLVTQADKFTAFHDEISGTD
jgi:hypothetical protein